MVPEQRIPPADAPVTREQPKTGQRPATHGLVRVTVNLTPRTEKALDRLGEEWGVNKTDVINRSVQLAERLQRLTFDGCLVVRVDGRHIEVHLL